MAKNQAVQAGTVIQKTVRNLGWELADVDRLPNGVLYRFEFQDDETRQIEIGVYEINDEEHSS